MAPRHCPVVVGYDFSHSGYAALCRAVTIAAGAPHHVLHIVCAIDPRAPIPSIPSYNGIDTMYAARVQEALLFAVQEQLERTDCQHRIHFFVHARIGRAAEEILGLACEVGADLIVVGSHNLSGMERLILGSVSDKIVRDAGCSVEVARPKQYAEVSVLPWTEVDGRDPTHLPPHRYEYEEHRVVLRPFEGPLY